MSSAPVCHVSTGSRPIPQPLATRMPSIPVAVDLPSAIAAINQLKIIIQQLSGQTPLQGAPGTNGLNGFIQFVPAGGTFDPATGTFIPATGSLPPPPGAVVPNFGGSVVPNTGGGGVLPIGGGGGGGLLAGSGGSVISTSPNNQKGNTTAGQGGRFVEDRSLRITQKKRIFQDNDRTSENWVDIDQINRVVWIDTVTGQTIVWTR